MYLVTLFDLFDAPPKRRESCDIISQDSSFYSFLAIKIYNSTYVVLRSV